ncbi:MAG TPA: chemotaxis protein CheW [Gemmatimonadaceae bacterium]|jgi:purine-binding chemotaxis protein CheW
MVLNASGGDSYVLCELAGTTYALRSDDIEQLEMVGQLTPVPNAPTYVEGVTSVRGRVIPAVSLRARFGFERQAYDLRSRLIVVRSQARSVGLIVDSAREFAAISESNIQPPPEGLVELSTQYLRGITHLGDRLVLILDIAELLRVAESVPALSSETLPVLS